MSMLELSPAGPVANPSIWTAERDDQRTVARLEDLASAAYDYAVASRAPATIRAYRSDWADFTRWCDANGLQSMPAAPETVCLYLSALAGQRATATLARRLTSISQAHKAAGHPTPTRSEQVSRVWSGIRRTFGTAQVGKHPTRTSDIRRMVQTLDLTTPIGLRDRCLLVVGFAGAMRRSELVALDVADVVEVTDGLHVTIRRSKTDQEGRGAVLGLPFGSDPLTCPVRAVRDWRAVGGIDDGHLLRAIDRHGNVAERPLGARAVADRVKRAVQAVGLPPALYGGHSLRAGFITSAAEADVPERRIMDHSRHKSIAVMRRYVRDIGLFDQNAAAAIGL